MLVFNMEAKEGRAPLRIRIPVVLPELVREEDAEEGDYWIFLGSLFDLYQEQVKSEDRTDVVIKILRFIRRYRYSLLRYPDDIQNMFKMLKDIRRQIEVYRTIDDPLGIIRTLVVQLRQRLMVMY